MALTLAFALAVVAGIAAYGNLMLAVQQTRASQTIRQHAVARYAAQAGHIIAQERLWANPDYCTGANSQAAPSMEAFDANGDGDAANDNVTIALKVYPCTVGANRSIEVEVLF